MRASGATVREVRAFLGERGITRSYHGVSSLLGSRLVLGEIHFGDLVNLEAHPAIVDRETWTRVQRAKIPRGRKPKSERLLARLEVLRCASCGARMVVGSANHGKYTLYRCPPTGSCERRVTISAELVEGVVVDAVRRALAGAKGRASAEHGAREAERALDCAQVDLDAAIRAFSGFEDETAARDRLVELRETRDQARERVDRLSGTRTVTTISATADWDLLKLDERRALIRAVVERVTVAPGRGAGRVTVELVGE
jgi:hypothetical protein